MRMKSRSSAPWLAVLVFAACGEPPALLHHAEKVAIVNELRSRLLESVEAEKSAVLATTDEESQAFALESRHFAAEIDRLRARLHDLVAADARKDEIDELAAFDATWSELEGVDARLLELAVANTNLKAARLSAKEGSAALDRFVDAVEAMERASSDPVRLRALASASRSGLRIQSLLLAHIPSADPGEMTALEARMQALGESVDRVLADAREKEPKAPSSEADDASRAWVDYRRILAEVVRLSRQNTNVISFDVSVHEKRRATRACLDALDGLLAAVESAPRPTR
jgi:hypothetical protein